MFDSLKNKASTTCSTTIITICENHLLPAMLKTARKKEEKVLADTVIAGVLLMLNVKDFASAVNVWCNLVRVHCSKQIDDESRGYLKTASQAPLTFDDHEDIESDKYQTFIGEKDDEDEDVVVRYGGKETIRGNSPGEGCSSQVQSQSDLGQNVVAGDQ